MCITGIKVQRCILYYHCRDNLIIPENIFEITSVHVVQYHESIMEVGMSKILVVEDEQHQRELYAMELQEEGYDVDQASNGKEAVDMVKSNKYDLVILDIRMPEMDGIEALGKILSRDKKIPIIIYTAYSNYKSNFMTWTADAYITKSSNLDELKEKINELLSTRNQ